MSANKSKREDGEGNSDGRSRDVLVPDDEGGDKNAERSESCSMVAGDGDKGEATGTKRKATHPVDESFERALSKGRACAQLMKDKESKERSKIQVVLLS